jgi:hypothetical protein
MPKERTRRYSIEIKDATGRSVWFAWWQTGPLLICYTSQRSNIDPNVLLSARKVCGL